MKKENIFYTLGLLLIAAALLLSLYNGWMDRRAGAASEEALVLLEPQIPVTEPKPLSETPAADLPEYLLNPDIPMPVSTVNGYDYVGVLSLPALELELPILNEWDYDRLNISPCRFSGSLYRGDLVVCGHNYPLHFGKLKNLSYGDEVVFTDMDGNVFSYTVTEIEILPATALKEMTAGKYPLTLFTCDLNRTNRIAIRAR